MTVKKLTAKQEMFCREYLVDLNGTQAAIRAGYSANTANEIATENLAKPSIKKYLSGLKEKLQQKIEINAEWVLKQALMVHEMTIIAKDHANALKSLDLIGKHINIKAFDKATIQDNKIEVEIKVNSNKNESNKNESKDCDKSDFSFQISPKTKDT